MASSPALTSDFAAAPISLPRRIMDSLATGAAVAAVLLVLLPLGAIFAYLIYKGIGSINWAFLTHVPAPPGEPGGGMANAIAGSAYILLIASSMGVPIGIGAGIYLAEYGRNRFGNLIRFTADVLNLRLGCVNAGTLLRAGWRCSVGDDDDPNHYPHHRRNALAGPERGQGSGLRLGSFALADNSFHYAAHCHFRCNHRGDAGICSSSRRNCSAAVHRFRQSVLELEAGTADCCPVSPGIQLCDFAF